MRGSWVRTPPEPRKILKNLHTPNVNEIVQFHFNYKGTMKLGGAVNPEVNSKTGVLKDSRIKYLLGNAHCCLLLI